mmetsp:Transcript_47532/g.93766  ORF Transcript_47532/g.93766 Transcript_47532/m.93766 type:complete len:304 (-) Transcript_47532:13-924(-)
MVPAEGRPIRPRPPNRRGGTPRTQAERTTRLKAISESAFWAAFLDTPFFSPFSPTTSIPVNNSCDLIIKAFATPAAPEAMNGTKAFATPLTPGDICILFKLSRRPTERPTETKLAPAYDMASFFVSVSADLFPLQKLNPALYVWLIHCQKMLWNIVFGANSMPAQIGTLTGTKVDILNIHGTISSVWGWTADSRRVRASHKVSSVTPLGRVPSFHILRTLRASSTSFSKTKARRGSMKVTKCISRPIKVPWSYRGFTGSKGGTNILNEKGDGSRRKSKEPSRFSRDERLSCSWWLKVKGRWRR